MGFFKSSDSDSRRFKILISIGAAFILWAGVGIAVAAQNEFESNNSSSVPDGIDATSSPNESDQQTPQSTQINQPEHPETQTPGQGSISKTNGDASKNAAQQAKIDAANKAAADARAAAEAAAQQAAAEAAKQAHLAELHSEVDYWSGEFVRWRNTAYGLERLYNDYAGRGMARSSDGERVLADWNQALANMEQSRINYEAAQAEYSAAASR